MALTERQKEEAKEMFSKGYTTDQVFRHFGAQSIGRPSEIEIEESAIKDSEIKPNLIDISQKFTKAIGLGDATQTFGDYIARTRLGAKLTGTDASLNREYIEAPTGKELAGAALQTGATAISPLIAPVSLPAQVAAGAALGYVYDVGGDLIEGSTLQETLTPGVGTATGVVAPPLLKGAGRLFRGATPGMTDDVARLGTQSLPEGTVAQTVPETPTVPGQGVRGQVDQSSSALGQTITDFTESAKRAGQRVKETVQSKAEKAARLQNATPAVKQAIQVDLDDTLIDFATNADDATRQAARQMVEIAEAPKKLGTNARPTQVAEKAAIEQYDLVVKNKKAIGEQIGKISEEFPTLKTIDVTPTQNQLLDVMRANGIDLDIDGKLVAKDNLKITDEQLSAINKLFDKITKQNTLSAKNLHELDQWFSTTQRTNRMVDKIADVYVKVPLPDGTTKELNIYKVFRDAFGQRLDEVAPENLRALNKQYRQYSNFLEDVEGKLVSNPEFSDLVSGDADKFAEAGLRRIFGEGKGAAEREAIYNALDKVSRDLGYKGARADDLYAFGEALKDLYPETIQKTSFRGQIGSSIMDKLMSVTEVGKVAPQDKQAALKALLEASE